MIAVANRRHGASGEYIGRPSPLGNRFLIGRDGDRLAVIEQYRAWLARNMLEPSVADELQRLAAIAEQGDLTLVCWCAPHPCHGDVIAEVLRAMTNGERR